MQHNTSSGDLAYTHAGSMLAFSVAMRLYEFHAVDSMGCIVLPLPNPITNGIGIAALIMMLQF